MWSVVTMAADEPGQGACELATAEVAADTQVASATCTEAPTTWRKDAVGKSMDV